MPSTRSSSTMVHSTSWSLASCGSRMISGAWRPRSSAGRCGNGRSRCHRGGLQKHRRKTRFRFSGGLGHARHTVGCVVGAMPCQWMGTLRQFIGDIDLEDIAGGGLNITSRCRDVSPRLGFDAADIQGEGPGGQCPAHVGSPSAVGVGWGGRDLVPGGSRVAGAGGPRRWRRGGPPSKTVVGKRVRHDLTFLV